MTSKYQPLPLTYQALPQRAVLVFTPERRAEINSQDIRGRPLRTIEYEGVAGQVLFDAADLTMEEVRQGVPGMSNITPGSRLTVLDIEALVELPYVDRQMPDSGAGPWQWSRSELQPKSSYVIAIVVRPSGKHWLNAGRESTRPLKGQTVQSDSGLSRTPPSLEALRQILEQNRGFTDAASRLRQAAESPPDRGPAGPRCVKPIVIDSAGVGHLDTEAPCIDMDPLTGKPRRERL